MYCHLVTVKVGVERSADQWMQLNGLAFDQHGFKSLNTETVQRRRAVQQNRMLANHVFQDIPDFWSFFFNLLLGCLDCGCQTQHFQLVENERLEQLQRHLLWQAALMQFQLWTDHNDGTTGVVDTLAQKVLTEATTLTLDHVCQGFQWAFVGTGHDLAATAVVQQRINRFLQHALFVTHDDFRRLQFEQAFQTVVTVDDATIQIIQIGSCETTAI